MKKACVLLTGVGLIIVNLACNKLKQQCEGSNRMDYEFDLPFSINPATDTINLGDTIWIESRFDAQLLNKKNGKVYNVGKADFFISFNIGDLLMPVMLPTIDYFVVDSAGNYLPNTNPDGDNTNTVAYVYKDGYCYWKKGYVITKRGLYLLSFNSFIDRSHKARITECPNEQVQLNYNINNWSSNYYLLQYSSDENVKGWGEGGFNKSGNYAICVN